MIQFFQTYKNLILQTLLSLSLTLILTFLKIPILFLQGIHSYIHPDHVPQQSNSKHGLRPAIRRPSDPTSGADGHPNGELKRRKKTKDKFEFDETNAQIFRIKLDEGHLQSRLYFNEYHNCFIFSFVGISCFSLYKYLGVSEDDGVLANGSLIPVVFGFVGFFKVFSALTKLSFEKSASRKSEKQLSLVLGVAGFVLGISILFGLFPRVFDFKLDSVDGFWSFFVSVLMGCFAGLLYMPAGKIARSFWLGTDQIRSNLSIISSGWFAKTVLYANYILVVFTITLWINPFADILVNKNVNGSKRANTVGAERLVGYVGMLPTDFNKFRLYCLLFSGFLQLITLRSNLQIYLNEAVLSWYQRLHGSKVPDLEFSRAKVFLHNHYLCLAALQFFAPPLMVILFLGLSQMDGNSFRRFTLVCGSSTVPCSDVIKEVALFMAWWIEFVWAVYTSVNLLFYRCGILYVS